METTNWKLIEGYSRYEISNHGMIRRKADGRMIKGTVHPHGYINGHLIDDSGNRRPVKFHRLVCITHNGGAPSEQHTDVNHKDGDKANNYWKNLEWSTAGQNKLHASENGLIKATFRILLTDVIDGTTTILNSVKAVGRRFGLTKHQTYSLLLTDGLYKERFKLEVLKPGSTNQTKKVGIYGCDLKDRVLIRANSIYEMSLFMKIHEQSIRNAFKKSKLVNGCFFWIIEDPDWERRIGEFTEKQIEKSIGEFNNRKEGQFKRLQ